MNTLEAGHREVPAGWLLQDGPALFRQVRAFGRAAGTDETAVATSLLCQAWAVAVTREAIASLVGARRVPDLASSNTVLLFDGDGRPAGATLVSPRYAAVVGDEAAAADPLAEIVADDDALFAWTQRRLLDGHLAPLVEALHDLVPRAGTVAPSPTAIPNQSLQGIAQTTGQPLERGARAPVGRRLLWGNVAAATAGGFAALSALPDLPFDPDHLLLEAPRLLDRPGSPTEGLVELFPVPHGDGTRLFVRRQTCCLRYRLPDAPPTCLSCRLLPERERRRRIGLRLTAEAEAETG